MILSDREIDAAIKNGLITIDSRPEEKYWTSTAVDLTLHGVLLEWTPTQLASGQEIKPRPKMFNIQKMMEEPLYRKNIIIDPAHGYELGPRKFVLGYTRERIKLPHSSRIAARVEGKSSLARLGLGVHVTAPTIHAGFGFDVTNPERPGIPVQLEIFNLGEWTVVLDEGIPICQLILEEVREVPNKGYQGRFNEQTSFKA